MEVVRVEVGGVGRHEACSCSARVTAERKAGIECLSPCRWESSASGSRFAKSDLGEGEGEGEGAGEGEGEGAGEGAGRG